MLKRTILLALIVGTAACGPPSSGPGAKTGKNGKGGAAADADPGTTATATGEKVEEGSSVCVSDLLGVRYAVEDILAEAGLKVVADCMFADVEIAETGEPGAYEMKYRTIGGKWQSCTSKAKDRTSFIAECTDAIVKEGAGGGEEEAGDDKDED